MGPLRGVRVLDLSRLLPGPVCTHLLTRLGATVVKVEGRGAGQADYVRDLPPKIKVGPGRKHGAMFEALHAGKMGLSLDLKHADGAATLKKIVKHFDVIVEGNRPGVMERLGVGFEDLRKENNRLIYCSLTGYGQDGPWALKAGHDINYMALSGLLGITGNADEVPPTIGFQAADAAGAMQAVIGILSAIIERSSTGVGQAVDISLTEAVMTLGVPSLVQSLAGHVSKRGGDVLNGGLPNYKTYRTLDGQYLSVGALEAHFWKKLCIVINRPDLDQIADSATVEALFATKSLSDWQQLFHAADVCVEPIATPEEMPTHPQHVARQVILQETEADGTPGRKQLVLGPRFRSHPSVLLPPAPMIGEHTSTVLESYGFKEQEIRDLHASGAVYCLELDRPTAPPQFTQAKPYRVTLVAGKDYYWCKCGKSAKQPFCDGSHKRLGLPERPEKVIVTEEKSFAFCGCRLSEKGAQCDGAHKKLLPLQPITVPVSK